MATPVKNPRHSRSRSSDVCRISENFDPNVPISPPSQKPIKSPAIKSAQPKKSAQKTPHRVAPPPPPARERNPAPDRERKFIVAKKKKGRGGSDLDFKKCREEAYEALRASQEEFFRKDRAAGAATVTEPSPVEANFSKDGAGDDGMHKHQSEVKGSFAAEVLGLEGIGTPVATASGVQNLEGSSKMRKMRSLMMEEAMSSMPEPGSGRVKHLVKAFESLLSISEEREAKGTEERKQRVMNWPLPGLQQPLTTAEKKFPSMSASSSAEFFPTRDFDRDSGLYTSLDSKGDRLSWGSRTSGGCRRNRLSSSESLGRSWNKKLKVTSQQPFKLRTEQRGRLKEEEFVKKVKEMLMEEEKKRIPIAQGLPWTTDEPECLVKPPVKESTEPIDLLLHSDVRAIERAEFDHYVAERMNFAEQLRLERERQRELEEEEEIQRLRKELVPKAQPMPYFDRPFVPKRSTKPRTVPKEPRFHMRPMKSSRSSFSMLGR